MTEPQVEGLRQTVKKTSRNPHRDSTMILVAYRHGMRVGEVTELRWEDVHLDRAEIYVRRLKSSKSTMHPLQGDELRALRKLQREKTSSLSFVFISEQGGPLSIDAVEYMFKRAGQAAGIPHVHPHMLRHGCGYRLVNQCHKFASSPPSLVSFRACSFIQRAQKGRFVQRTCLASLTKGRAHQQSP